MPIYERKVMLMNQSEIANNRPRASPSEAPHATVFFVGGKSGNGRNDRDGKKDRDGINDRNGCESGRSLDHSHRAHSLLSASSSKRWLNCPPSAVLNDRFPDKTSVFAAEGTAMHERCEWKLRSALGEIMDEPHSEYDTEETDQVTDVYAEFCLTEIEKMRRSGMDPLVLIEERLDYTHVAPGGFGTGDLVLVGKDEDGRGLIHVIDFKGGRGVRVDNSRENPNSQMMLYAIGALKAYSWLVNVEIVKMTIIQPRLDNYPSCELTVDELNAWAEEIRPVALMAYEGKGEQRPGDWCLFCKAKAVCRACAEEALALAREEFTDLDEETASTDADDAGISDLGNGNPGNRDPGNGDPGKPGDAESETAESTSSDLTEPYELDRQTVVFKSPNLISLPELAAMLPTLRRIASWIEAVFAYVSAEAITSGIPIPGYKVVEGRARRIFSDAEAAAKAAESAGVTNIYKTELKSLAEIEKMMGKKRFAEVLGEYVIKPPGKLSLVEESDPRPAVNTAGPARTSSTEEFEVLE